MHDIFALKDHRRNDSNNMGSNCRCNARSVQWCDSSQSHYPSQIVVFHVCTNEFHRKCFDWAIWFMNEHVGFLFSSTFGRLDLNALRFWRKRILDSNHFSDSCRNWTFIWLWKQLESCNYLVSKKGIGDYNKSYHNWQYSWSANRNCFPCIFHYWSCKFTFTLARSNQTADYIWN